MFKSAGHVIGLMKGACLIINDNPINKKLYPAFKRKWSISNHGSGHTICSKLQMAHQVMVILTMFQLKVLLNSCSYSVSIFPWLAPDPVLFCQSCRAGIQ